MKHHFTHPATAVIKLLIAIFCIGNLFSCDDDTDPIPEEETPVVVSELAIYKPLEFGDMDYNNNSSTWSFERSRESDHFIVFWDTAYGTNDPNDAEIPATYRVDIDDLLSKAEAFYALNVDELLFAQTGLGYSQLDTYKMMIFLYYQDEWLATGSGYDDVIGALWVNPSTCQPVGSTIAHEIGHSFQYQVFADLGGGSGFRYGFGGNGGNTFWEQTAQWQSFQTYQEEAFTTYYLDDYFANYFKHPLHEDYRYASYWLLNYWSDIHGKEIIGQVWREAQQPEDPIEAYQRLTGIDNTTFNDEIYDAASKFATWDLDYNAIRTYGEDYQHQFAYQFDALEGGTLRSSYATTPQTAGYNVVPLSLPENNTTISVAFTGLINEAGYNTVADPSRAGWRYGFVALLENGTRVYSDMQTGSTSTSTATFEVPENAADLYLVVTGAPTTYAEHPWDDEPSNDDQWPYTVSFTNTNVSGYVVFNGDETPEDVDFTFDIALTADDTNYTSITQNIPTAQLATAFVLQPSEISSLIGTNIVFYAEESDGNLSEEYTANGYGHWFDANGDVIGWGESAVLFSEFDEAALSFSVGQYPTHALAGTTYTIKQALVYTPENGNSVTATFTFHVTMTE
ncbi:protein of unknown function [Pustulibacterium marinum]|uniref:DUF4859 domain-containing protein n=1 Tax=Pustulibacterium marinum TaxID=1224947 RepID=A0A1I7IU67_9FLAO|nr:DUF4859 domain-containing protein [Pustulibacterium marinum]SFU76477.1 protein of unknown function [Pustulibacterium marinum]